MYLLLKIVLFQPAMLVYQRVPPEEILYFRPQILPTKRTFPAATGIHNKNATFMGFFPRSFTFVFQIMNVQCVYPICEGHIWKS